MSALHQSSRGMETRPSLTTIGGASGARIALRRSRNASTELKSTSSSACSASTSAASSRGRFSRHAFVRQRFVQYLRVRRVFGKGVPQYEQLSICVDQRSESVDQHCSDLCARGQHV